jgi:zinc protease
MKISVTLLMLWLCLVTVSPAQSPATPVSARGRALPTFDQLQERLVAAIGGAEALRKVTSRRVAGEFEIEGMNLTGSFESLTAAPVKSVTTLDVPGVGQFRQVVNGEKAWSLDPLSGLRELAGPELAAFLRDADFYRELNLKTLFAKIEVTGRLRLGDQEAWIVNAVPASGEAEQLYFDVTSGLLIRHDTKRESPQGAMPTETFFTDYRIVDGLRLPWRIRQQTPAFTINLTYREVKHNLPIDEAKFARPVAP